MRPHPVDEVSEVDGWINVITLLPRRERLPAVTLHKLTTGRYRVDFIYNAQLVALLKTVPAAMRRWRDAGKYWEVSVDWVGPLVCALRNAGVAVNGLDELDVTEWASWYLPAMPSSRRGSQAYVIGLCETCRQVPHRPGGTECAGCHRQRVARSHRVLAALTARGLASWPRAIPSKGELLSLRAPVLVDEVNDWTPTPAPDVETVDAVIAAVRTDNPACCPICGRRPAKGVVAHVRCRRHLLHLLAEKPFSKPRNRAYQSGLCSVCMARPHQPPGRITCEHCGRLVRQIEARSAKQNGERRCKERLLPR
jgi:hypothetical protein